MLWFCALLLVISAFVGYGMWPQDQRSLKAVVSTGLIIGTLAMIGVYITQLWPTTHIEIKEIQKKYVDPPKVVYKDRIVYRAPGKEVEPVKPAEICAGSRPVRLLTIDISTKNESDTTWVIAHPVGSEIKITCYVSGNLSNFWKVGDIVQFTQGHSQ